MEYNNSMARVRVDILLVERGLAESRSQAQRLVMAGQVRADGQVVSKPSVTVPSNVKLSVDEGPAYVSRGGEKLAAALEAFGIQVTGKVCADVGASTGGFSDCLLRHGAKKVYAIDVGQGVLHWGLRQDERVVVMEGTNARYLTTLAEPVALITIDVSFISIKILLPVVVNWFDKDGGQVVALIKPQFEAGREESSRGKGVIRDAEVHRRVLGDVLGFAGEQGFGVEGSARSPLIGPKGNVEFLAHLVYPGRRKRDLSTMIDKAIGE
jgi:23S rRNA (cytidine1920-2'-O)/16S rRNA (cytidine1409-2'-O)-methyltransferase